MISNNLLEYTNKSILSVIALAFATPAPRPERAYAQSNRARAAYRAGTSYA